MDGDRSKTYFLLFFIFSDVHKLLWVAIVDRGFNFA